MVRKTFLVWVLVMIAAGSFAQQTKSLWFKEETFDFGTVNEEGGPVTHEFVFTNNSGRPVKVLSVQASCGCTTPGWSKEAVQPSKTGFIQASFNPKGRPGTFNKTLTVTTDLDGNQLVLQIKGHVEAGSVPVETDYQASNGSWKLRTASFNIGKVFIQDASTVREFPFVNSGSKLIAVTGKVVAPAHIKAEVIPPTIGPGQKGIIRLTYNSKLQNKYGFQLDNIEISTDDELNPVKSFDVRATVEDYFPPLSSEELAKAPRLNVSTAFDFGRIKQNSEATRQIQFTNTGKKELTIKSLQGNCACLSVVASKYSLKPGESSLMNVTFKPETRSGSQNKAITIYSNDPQGPVQRVSLSAYVED